MFRKLLNPFSFAARRIKLSPREYLIYGGAGLLLLALVICYGFEIKWYKRITYPGRLLAYAALGGALLGVVGGFALRQMLERRRGKPFSQLERMQLQLIAFLLSAFFAPLFGSWINRALAGPPQWETFVFYKEQAHASSRYGYVKGESIRPDGYYLYVLRNGRLHRFDLPQSVAKGLKQGADISLPMRKGMLGSDVLDIELLLIDNQ